jgi:TatD DNase family protein
MRVFRSILERCADYGDKILTIHSRRSSADVVSTIGGNYPGRIILHWFSGPQRDLKTAIEYGMFFSVNPAMTRSAAGQKLIAKMPPDRVLTESDGPFVRTGSRPCCPKDTEQAIAYLASCWECSTAHAAERVRQNFLRIVGVS